MGVVVILIDIVIYTFLISRTVDLKITKRYVKVILSWSQDTGQLFDQLRHNLAAFSLKMQTILNVPEKAVQEIVEQLDQLFQLSKPLIKAVVSKVLTENQYCVPESVVD